MKNIVAIIHARGGSKRIPLKNIKLLDGKPLVSYMINAALKAKKLSRVIVSTDHPEIIRIAKECGAQVPFVRPKDISEDVPSEMVTQHAIKFLEDESKQIIDVAVTMQPTTPFCRPEDIDGAIQMLLDSDADSVVSVKEIHDRPEWMFSKDENHYAKKFLSQELRGALGVSQTLPKMYMPNGGIYATRRDVLFNKDSVFGEKIKLWVMPRELSVDIDEPIDFEFADFLAKKINSSLLVK